MASLSCIHLGVVHKAFSQSRPSRSHDLYARFEQMVVFSLVHAQYPHFCMSARRAPAERR